MFSLNKFSPRSFDWVLFITAMLLVSMGLTAIYSVDLSRGAGLIYFKKQLISASLGLILLLGGSLVQYAWFRSYAKLFYVFSLSLLGAVLVFGTNIRGTKGWFVFGGFSFQPAEVAKIGMVLMLAYVVYNFGRRFERPLFFFGTSFITLAVIALIMLQPDLGSAVIIGTIWFGVMLLVGARRLFVIGLMVAVVIFAIASWFFFLQPYQKDRLTTFINPAHDPLGRGYNSIQALIAVGAGKWSGRGLGFGSQSQLRFLPEAQTDFIFTVIAEELGFAGVVAFLVLFGALLWRLVLITKRSDDDFVSVAVSGIAILFFTQFFINVGANIGILPITGVPLPFVSYGGSSLVVNLFLVGVAEAMVEKKY
ncbi:MAG: rod shape-determining protein RodA [Candidatus Magasanikbacteria bacterium]|nr:rod shape-determining protein RodA [Candidatus Magasanikbacteria bacterium]